MSTKSKEKKQALFCPGPVNVAKNVKDAAVNNEIGHREPEFSVLLESINKKVLKLFMIKKVKEYQPLIISGSGTAANEAIFSSVVGEQNVLVISNGEFGERLVEISKIYNKNTSHIQYSWGQEFDLPNIEKYLQTNKVDIVAVVHHETSTGMLNPILKIGQMAKKYSMTYIVDAVSSAGAEQISIEKCKIDYLSTSASKAIGSLPGVSIVVGKISELEKIKNYEVKTIYLNLNKFYLFARNYSQTPNTPAVQSFFALDQALENITSKTDKHFQNINKITALCRAGLKKLGLKFILDKESTMSVVLTTVFAPEGVDVTILKRKLRDKNIIIYDGKGVFKNKAFQVSIIGNQNVKDIKYFLKSLKEVLETFKK